MSHLRRCASAEPVVSHGFVIVAMTGVGDTTLISGASVSAGMSPLLGVPPALGRWFTSDEENDGSHVIVLADDAWRRYFGAAPNVLQKTVTFSGNSSFTAGIVLGSRA